MTDAREKNKRALIWTVIITLAVSLTTVVLFYLGILLIAYLASRTPWR